MKTLEEILNDVTKMYAFLKQSYNEKDGNTLSDRITKLNATLAYSAELLPDAEYHLNHKRGVESEKIYKDERLKSLKPTEVKFLLEGRTSLEQRVYTQCERINKTITHHLEGLRSQLSFLKEEMRSQTR